MAKARRRGWAEGGREADPCGKNASSQRAHGGRLQRAKRRRRIALLCPSAFLRASVYLCPCFFFGPPSLSLRLTTSGNPPNDLVHDLPTELSRIDARVSPRPGNTASRPALFQPASELNVEPRGPETHRRAPEGLRPCMMQTRAAPCGAPTPPNSTKALLGPQGAEVTNMRSRAPPRPFPSGLRTQG